MRDIVFRGKRVIDGKWVEGSLLLNGDCAYIYGGLDFPEGPGWYLVDPKTVGQYVGREDKHGKRIFEGDILIAWRKPMVATFDQDNCQFCVEYTIEGMRVWNILYGSDKHLEVIGNVHDNPELLEESK